MRWSKVLRTDSTPAQKEQSTVLEFRPKEFDFGTPQSALDYLQMKKQGSDFVMNDVLRTITGVEKLEKQTEEEKIEAAVLGKVSEIQKIAYDEGFKLGQEEGYREAYEKKSQELQLGRNEIKVLLESLNELKKELIEQNERHIVTLIYNLAEKIAFDEIEKKPEVIMNIITKAIEQAQLDEDIHVTVSSQQLDFIEKLRQNQQEEFEVLKNVKITGSEEIKPGGCVIETNYGVIDAQIHERTEKLWQELYALMPKLEVLKKP
jgi:flagellar assembly protein FliH